MKALRGLGGVAGRNPALPILSNVLLKRDENQLRLTTTDLEVGITAWLPGKLRGDGALTIPLRPLAEYAQNLPSGNVTLRFARGALAVSTEGSHAVFQGESAENFPLIPQLKGGTSLSLPLKMVARALDGVLYASATDDTRPELAGVLFRTEGATLTLAATDSYRLSEASLALPASVSAPLSFILPARAAQEMRRALDGVSEALLHVGEGQVLLATPTLHVTSRLVDGTYPDYRQIVPRTLATTVEVDRAQLLRAIRAAAVFRGSLVSRVVLETGTNTLRIAATAAEMGETETELPAEVKGGSVSIAFNERFLRDALGALVGERVVIGLEGASTPAVFRAVAQEEGGGKEGDSPPTILALVMPIKT